VQTELLEKNREVQLKVYAVWFNMMWSDSRDRWPRDVLTDPRVAHFWDEAKVVGRWYEENVTHQGTPGGGRVEWDAYFLYGHDASWGEKAAPVSSWGHPIVGNGDRLRRELRDLLSARPGTPNPTAGQASDR
jgi:hypothetical protein